MKYSQFFFHFVFSGIALTLLTPFKVNAAPFAYACADVQVINNQCVDIGAYPSTGIPVEEPKVKKLADKLAISVPTLLSYLKVEIGISQNSNLTYSRVVERISDFESRQSGTTSVNKIVIKSSGWHNDSVDAKAPACSSTGTYHITYRVFTNKITSGATRHFYGGQAKTNSPLGTCITNSSQVVIG